MTQGGPAAGAGATPPFTGDPSQTEMSVPSTGTTTMQPTKFSKLLRVVMPIIQGGAAGGFGGNSRVQGSGFAASQNMFNTQRAFALQQLQTDLRRQILQRQVYDDQYRNALEAARTKEAEAQGRRYDELATAQTKTKPVIEDTDAGLMSVSPDTAEAQPVQNMAPEQTGSLPLPNEASVAPLHKAQKPAPPEKPVVLSQGAEAVDPKTGKVIAKGAPKTFAPRAAKAAKPDEGNVENWAQNALQLAGNDPEAAVAGIMKMKTIPDDQKFAVIARIRKLKPATKTRRFQRTPEEMKKMATAPPS